MTLAPQAGTLRIWQLPGAGDPGKCAKYPGHAVAAVLAASRGQLKARGLPGQGLRQGRGQVDGRRGGGLSCALQGSQHVAQQAAGGCSWRHLHTSFACEML